MDTAHGVNAGPESAGIFAAIDAGDHTDFGVKQRGHNVAQVVRLHFNVAVAGNQNVVGRDFGHAVERPCRRIGPRGFAIYDNAAADLRIAGADLAHDIERGIVSSIGGKQNFVVTVSLDKKAFHILFELRIKPMHRFQ